MALPQVIVEGYDLVELGYVDEINNIQEYKTFDKDKVIANTYTLNVKNFDEFFSVDNPISIFNSTNWQYTSIKVYDGDGELIWDGLIDDIPRDHATKQATIESISNLQKYAEETVAYESADWETAADAAKNILDSAGFTKYNNASFQNSIGTLTTNSCYIKAYFWEEDDVRLQPAVEKLAEYGSSDVYSHKGVLYFKHFEPFTGNVKVYLTKTDLLRSPKVYSLKNNIINKYSIYYDGGGPVNDSTAGNIGSLSRNKFGIKSLAEMGGGSNTEVIIKDEVSAQYIGESLIKRSHYNLDNANVRALQAIEFSLKLDYSEYIDLNTYFRLTFSDEGWTEKLFEIFLFERDYKSQSIKITAYEVDE